MLLCSFGVLRGVLGVLVVEQLTEVEQHRSKNLRMIREWTV